MNTIKVGLLNNNFMTLQKLWGGEEREEWTFMAVFREA